MKSQNKSVLNVLRQSRADKRRRKGGGKVERGNAKESEEEKWLKFLARRVCVYVCVVSDGYAFLCIQ